MEYTVALMNKTLAATFVTLAVAALVTGTTTIGTLQSANAMCDDNSAARRSSKRPRYLKDGCKVQSGECRGLYIGSPGWNNSSWRPS
jgi:hypothetical protein